MLFHSYLFVFIFLPVSLAGYYLLAGRGKGAAARLWLAAVSLWFYGSFRAVYLLILLGSAVFNYGIYLRMEKQRDADSGDRLWLAFGVCGNLALLAYFKYTNFFLENLYRLGGKEFTAWKILLPVGISFFTFQQISFLVDGYRGEIKGCGFLDYLLYIVYFPKLVEGPLVKHEELLLQFAAIGKNCFDGERFIQGIALFIMGLLKKVILADTFGGAVDYGYSNLALMHGLDAALLVFFYALQLYFDFSGYCDMARGVSWMFGIELPVNFNSPYKAGDIVDFWKRWHITLNRFFTKYVYIPLGGNRRGKWRTYRNLLAVFFLSGIWHGAGWNFILWGMMHGVLYVLTRMWQGRRAVEVGHAGKEARAEEVHVEEKARAGEEVHAGAVAVCCRKAAGGVRRLAGVAATFLYVSVAWVYFRAESVAQGNELLVKIFRNDFVRVNRNLAGYFNLDEFWYVLKVLRLDRWEFGHYILMAVITAGSLLLIFFGKNAAQAAERMKPGIWNAVLLAVMLLWCVLSFSNVSTFLYFNF